MTKINWVQKENKTWKGEDAAGNSYFMGANRETYLARTKDGFRGCGWTAEEALANAKAERLDILSKHNKVLAEMKNEGPSSRQDD
jgi:hypothetical protein